MVQMMNEDGALKRLQRLADSTASSINNIQYCSLMYLKNLANKDFSSTTGKSTAGVEAGVIRCRHGLQKT